MRTLFFIAVYIFYALPTQAQTPEKQVFFRNEGNIVVLPTDIEINDSLKWQVYNGTYREGRNKREIKVYPDTVGKCKVQAILAGKNIWEDEYEVRPVPKKPVYYWANEKGDTIDTNLPTPISLDAKYQLCAKAEIAYAKNLGATYGGDVVGWIYRGKKKRCVKAIGFDLNKPIDLKTLGVRKGDVLMIFADVSICHRSGGHYHHIPRSGYFYIYLE